MTNFFESFEFWKLLICLFGGMLGAFVLYFKSKDFSRTQKYVLQFLRFVSVFLLLFLLVAPDFRFLQMQYDRPVVVLFVDNSESLESYEEAVVNAVKEDQVRYEDLGYEVQIRSFEGKVKSLDSVNFNYQSSPLARSLLQTQDFYSGQSLGKIVCYTDGIENTGRSLQTVQLTSQIDVVGVGDTIPKHDVRIESIAHNPTVFKGNDFVVRLNASSQLDIDKDVFLKVSQNGKQLLKKKIHFLGKSLTEDVVFRPQKEGLQQFEVIIDDSLDINTANNTKSIFVQVLKEAEEVLLVYSAPHPDIKMLKTVFESSQNLKLSCVSIQDVNISDVSKYQLMILHGLPNTSFINKQNALSKVKVSKCYWLTNSSNIKIFGKSQSGLKVRAKNGFVKVRPSVSQEEELFQVDSELQDLFGDSPVLDVAYGDYVADVRSKVVLKQSIGSIETDNVLAQVRLGDISEGVIVGEGFWKMRLYWNMQGKDVTPFDSFLKNYFQLLLRTTQENRLLVEFSKDVYSEQERSKVSIDVFNDLYERMINVPVSLKLTAKKGQEYTFNLLSNVRQPFKLPELAIGEYEYVARATIGKEVFVKKGKVLVKKLNLEQDSGLAQFNRLKVLSVRHKGLFSVLGGQLSKESEAKKIVTSIIDYKEVVDYRILFYILCLVLFTEWFLRKYFGCV